MTLPPRQTFDRDAAIQRLRGLEDDAIEDAAHEATQPAEAPKPLAPQQEADRRLGRFIGDNAHVDGLPTPPRRKHPSPNYHPLAAYDATSDIHMTPTRFRECLDALGWTQRQFAERIEVDSSRVRRMATGAEPISFAIRDGLEELASVLARVRWRRDR